MAAFGDPLLLLLISFLVFLVSFTFANVGLGGGTLYVPILLLLFLDEDDIVVPISLMLAVATAISSAWNHWKKGFVHLPIGRSLFGGALVGAILGTTFTLNVLTRFTFKVFFSALLFLLACVMLYDWYHARRVDQDDDTKLTRSRLAVVSMATAASGFVSGSAGVGGGVLNVPIIARGLGRRTRTAIGTSSFLIVPTAMFGFLTYLVRHAYGGRGVPAEFSIIPILFPLALVGAFVGSRWGLNALRTRSVALLFIGVVFLADALVVLDVLGII